MSWIEEQTSEAVRNYAKVMTTAELKDFFEAYWPDEDDVKEDPALQEEEGALNYAMDGFADNNHDSGGDVGVDMLCAMLDHSVEKQSAQLIEDIAARLLADLTLVDVILDGWTDELIERMKDDGEEIPPQDDIRKEVVDAWKSNAPEGYYGEFESLEVIMIHIEHETKNRK